MNVTIQVRVDEELKIKSESLFRDLGTDLTSAIRMFLTQAIAHNGFPFEIKKTVDHPFRPMTEDEILDYLALSREQDESGKKKDFDPFIVELKKKYGL